MSKRNHWMDGHAAAMRAGNPSQISDALAKSAAETDFQKKLFVDGWRSAWSCERRDDDEARKVQL